MQEKFVPGTMYAAVWHGRPELTVEALPVPEIGPGELLVKIEACGLCPTDIKKIDFGLIEPPAILGHEMVGRVVAAGNGAEQFTGRRVAIYHHVPCRHCRLCKLGLFSQCPEYKKTGTTAGFSAAGGGWAEYVKVFPWIVSGGGVVEIPESLAAIVGILMEPLNTCVKCIDTVQEPRGEVIILGQGPVGLMLTALASRKGWQVLAVEPLAERQAKALRFGAKAVLSPDARLASELEKLTAPLGADAAIAATESEEAIAAALRALRPGGTLILFAYTHKGQKLQLDAGEIGVAEKRVVGSYSSSIELNSKVKEILLDSHFPWGEFVTHVFPLRRINQALALARQPHNGSLKVAVAPDRRQET